MSKVHLDFGHGGRDPGAVANGIREKDITLSVGLEVGRILKAHKVSVSYSRTTDVFVSLQDRVNKANREKADIFVSIHVNSATNKSANGVETFSHTNSTKGRQLAKAIQDSLVADRIFKSNRGIKTANFYVLRRTIAPAALTELGFLPNAHDANIIRTKQKEMAISVAKGILNHIGVKYVGGGAKPIPQPSKSYMGPGDRGNNVKTLQADLNKLGAKIAVDGSYGPATRKAVVDFQTKYKLKIDGYAGKETQSKIKELLAPKPARPGFNIMSKTNTTIEQMKEWARRKGAVKLFIDLAPSFYEISNKAGVNPLVTYCQSAKETGYMKFGGVLNASFKNPCGLKTKDGGGNNDPNAHQRFKTWEEGIQAQVDHLALYAGAPGYPKPNTPDPRHFPFIRGTAKTVQALGGKWAPAGSYGEDIVKMISELEKTIAPIKPVAKTIKVDLLGKKTTVNGDVKNGTNYIKVDGKDIPMRDIFESMGFKVSWDSATKTVVID